MAGRPRRSEDARGMVESATAESTSLTEFAFQSTRGRSLRAFATARFLDGGREVVGAVNTRCGVGGGLSRRGRSGRVSNCALEPGMVTGDDRSRGKLGGGRHTAQVRSVRSLGA